ncbi:DNA mismatch repair endonuclease MutL [Porphyromonadaceae bacterium OttesenSCG-928-L07]|nr:DNA mismatch repair endonuclease MutL [Porphyromonadaceae bacterium OttesenSCG-928-L07]MDL2251674.1 DNA mismatch repair endonuclease MutL [Odoribacter sp. OttesenSCG-928-J03]
MSDIIQLLPDSVANQIAAGEVVQRPASVVKELVENAVDAGARCIRVVLKNVGKTLIQVIDDGKGMSPMDARMAFERHATSKISSATDLFNIHTLGFRGEALPSIASVAEVELKSKREMDELGTYICISASEYKEQSAVSMPQGTNISVKNLFFNIPARRKFLKSDTTELKNIINEFLRVALTYPEISFSLENNGNEVYNLPASALRQRIVNAFGKGMNAKLIHIDCDTELISIKGFVCHPQHAKKTYGEQYFFVNNRFMKHNFFHKAVTEAFSGLIPSDAIPSYFLYFSVDPGVIDVNIHPTKTEIKFQNETDFFQIIMAGIKEALGKFNITPPLDFDMDGDLGFVGGGARSSGYVPKVTYTPGYNPFNYNNSISPDSSEFEQGKVNETPHHTWEPRREAKALAHWEDLFEGLQEKEEKEQLVISGMEQQAEEVIVSNAAFLQMKGRYIVTTVHSGLMFINQKRAHERILFEQYMGNLSEQKVCGQKCLFPENLELSAADFALIKDIREDLEYLGFELTEFGKSCFAIYATPPDLPYSHAREVLMQLIDHYKNTEGDIKGKMKERIALSLAKAAAIPYNKQLFPEEMSDMVDNLFSCQHHNYTADGKTIIHILNFEDVNQWFK